MVFPKRVHCIGVGGIGVSAVAKYLKLRGVSVSGSDAKESEITQEVKKVGVQIWYGTHPDKMGKDIELVIYSAAVSEDNEERIRGRHLGALEISYNAFLGELTNGHKTIAITGTKGKSTTTALIGHILKTAGLAPTVIVGSKSPAFSTAIWKTAKMIYSWLKRVSIWRICFISNRPLPSLQTLRTTIRTSIKMLAR